jgi:hypothetical protein
VKPLLRLPVQKSQNGLLRRGEEGVTESSRMPNFSMIKLKFGMIMPEIGAIGRDLGRRIRMAASPDSGEDPSQIVGYARVAFGRQQCRRPHALRTLAPAYFLAVPWRSVPHRQGDASGAPARNLLQPNQHRAPDETPRPKPNMSRVNAFINVPDGCARSSRIEKCVQLSTAIYCTVSPAFRAAAA